ncbi:MAG: iron-sulfur cluster-binding oxidoreductase [Deltaproteobacteria bacterium]|nr:iron-sulfur cluster-binding oxidoreductase [Deltaproteobacteria bacterium]
MKSQARIQFAKDPKKFLERAITKFVQESPSNRRKVDGGRYFDSPLVGFASADDSLFQEYKKIIGRFHFSPREIFDLTFGASEPHKKLSVISWVLPICEDTRKANRKADKFPALLWSHTRYFGEPFNVKLRNHVVSLLKRKGYNAVAPTNSPHFIHHRHAPKVGFTSNFSERHAAYACGLGTFGLCDGFITPKGKAMRIGTVVTDLVLTPSERPYAHHHVNCLYYFNGTCKACAARCPAGAITSKGHDKDKCFDFMHNVSSPANNAQYGVKITGCGLCQTKVPCEFEIPKPIRKHSVLSEK